MVEISPSNVSKEADYVMFVCHTAGTQPVGYSWFKDGMMLTWNSRTHDINHLQRTDEGTYHCGVSNVVGEETSHANHLTVFCEYATFS